MPITMLNGCGCQLGRLGEEPKTADYYINATLEALKPVTVYKYPGGPVLREVQPGSIVGEIFSWVQRDGDLWWQLKEGGYAKHGKGVFDMKMAELTSRGKQEEILQRAQEGSSAFPPLPSASAILKSLIPIAVIAAVGYAAVLAFAPTIAQKIVKPKTQKS